MAEYKQVNLFGGAKFEIEATYKLGNISQDITGFTFTANFLDGRGGDKLLTINPSIIDSGSGIFLISVTKAQVLILEFAKWFELYVVPGSGDPLKWMDLPVKFYPGGK